MAFDFNKAAEEITKDKDTVIDNIIMDIIINYINNKYKDSNIIEFDTNNTDKVLTINIYDSKLPFERNPSPGCITFILDFGVSDIVITSGNNLNYSYIHNTVNTVLKAPGVSFNNFIIQSSGKNFDYFLRVGSWSNIIKANILNLPLIAEKCNNIKFVSMDKDIENKNIVYELNTGDQYKIHNIPIYEQYIALKKLLKGNEYKIKIPIEVDILNDSNKVSVISKSIPLAKEYYIDYLKIQKQYVENNLNAETIPENIQIKYVTEYLLKKVICNHNLFGLEGNRFFSSCNLAKKIQIFVINLLIEGVHPLANEYSNVWDPNLVSMIVHHNGMVLKYMLPVAQQVYLKLLNDIITEKFNLWNY